MDLVWDYFQQWINTYSTALVSVNDTHCQYNKRVICFFGQQWHREVNYQTVGQWGNNCVWSLCAFTGLLLKNKTRNHPEKRNESGDSGLCHQTVSTSFTKPEKQA